MSESRPSTTPFLALLGLALLACLAGACRHGTTPLAMSQDETFAELRAVKGRVTVTPAGETARDPYPRERIADAETVTLDDGGLAWLRADTGAVWLVSGPGSLVLHSAGVAVSGGRAFVDTNGGPPAELDTPDGHVELSDARVSVEVRKGGGSDVYVLRGSARGGSGGRAGPGELLSLAKDHASTHTPELAWDDWTGGLATADPAAEPAPFGLGTVGARPAGDQGKPRFSLVVQRLDVRVTVDHDFAVTEVDETFVNPTSAVVEGLFSFRTPPGAVLQRFGVDRDGDLVWGRVKESAAALAQYQSNVYAGSTEDPALLQWIAPGQYSARLYPIAQGAQRRVVTRYAEWLPRQGPRADRRLYVYPMAAEGARGSLPRIEELTVTFDLAKAGAQRVRAGMQGKRDGNQVIIKAFDVVPLADLAVELFDDGQSMPVAYRAPHALDASDAPVQAAPDFAAKVSKEEPDYLLVPLRSTGATELPPGVDLAIVVDTSAATESGALAVARSLTSALLAQLGPLDRAALWAGDATLHPVVDGSGALSSLDGEKRRAWLEGLSGVERGGATDIGALLTDAASRLDPKRRGAVVYIGDGQPSVGEMAPKALRDRLARLPQGSRVFAVALGSNANVPLLQTVARGASVEVVNDAYAASRAALRLLEAANRATWVGATVDLGPGVERVLPRELPAVGSDEGVLVVGRVTGKPPTELTLRGNGQTLTQPIAVVPLDDAGDLRRRWGEGRLAELLEEGAGRAAVVDVARRYALVSPFTSLYVPTTREMEAAGEAPDLEVSKDDRRSRWKPWWPGSKSEASVEVSAVTADDKEGGFGTRAKGEEGSMGNPKARARSGAAMPPSPSPSPPPVDEPPADRRAAMHEAANFGMIGLIPPGAAASATAAPVAPAAAAPPVAPWGRVDSKDAEKQAPANAFGGDIGDSTVRTELGVSGSGPGGGERAKGSASATWASSVTEGARGTGRGSAPDVEVWTDGHRRPLPSCARDRRA